MGISHVFRFGFFLFGETVVFHECASALYGFKLGGSFLVADVIDKIRVAHRL